MACSIHVVSILVLVHGPAPAAEKRGCVDLRDRKGNRTRRSRDLRSELGASTDGRNSDHPFPAR